MKLASGLIASIFGFAGILAPALAQQNPDGFVRPPPTQSPQTPPGQTPPQPPGQPPAVITMDMLTRQGFEVKAVTRASDRTSGFVVLLQRAGETRTCLLQIRRDQRGPQKDTVCF